MQTSTLGGTESAKKLQPPASWMALLIQTQGLHSVIRHQSSTKNTAVSTAAPACAILTPAD